ncbi:MAG: hypothetical protein LBS92_00865 [Candidatus Methanoplasma sp.]|jgi:hypothetical protein|nr:hypothetical protein [Candidatus Methanoplasma sp.]
MSFKEDDFRAVLRLGEVWKVLSADTDHAAETVVVRVGSDRGQRFPCPGCGKDRSAHDFIKRGRRNPGRTGASSTPGSLAWTAPSAA